MRLPRFFNLRNKFILASAANIVLSLVLVVGLSYSRTINVLEQQVGRSNFQFVKQVADNIGMIFSDMKNSSVYLLQNKEFMNYLRLPESEIKDDPSHLLSIQKFVNNYLAFNPNIHSIYLDTFNGMRFDSQSAKNVISEDLLNTLLQLRGDGILMPDVITNYNGTKTDVFSYVKIIKDTDNIAIDLALLKINIPQTLITNTFANALLSPNSDFYIADENGKMIAALHKENIGMPLPDDMRSNAEFSKAGGYFNWMVNKTNTLVTHQKLVNTAWKLVNLVPRADLSHDIAAIRNLTLVSILLSLFCCFVIVSFFSVHVLSPLKELRNAMGKIEKEDFSVNIPVRGNDEIALLARSFNKMSNKLDELVNQVLTVEIEQKKAQLKALQAQINPHFLYNTLDTIYWTSRMENAHDSAALIQSLSKLFRLSLNSGSELMDLSREIAHLQLYIAIQQKRFEGRIHFALNVQSGLEHCRVVRLILQPLVENSITHGIEKNGGTGHVNIRIYAQDDTLIYRIEDDGIGADQKEVEGYLNVSGKENRGFAIHNVNERLRLYCGSGYGLRFETAKGLGMTVIVTQPLTPK